MSSQVGSARRIDELLRAASPAELLELAQGVGAIAAKRGLWTEVAGTRRPLPFAIEPWLLNADQSRRVHGLALQMRMALRRLCWLSDAYPAFHQVVPLDPVEAEWVDRYRRPDIQHGVERVFCRLDALMQDGPGSALQVRWLETNVVGIGGLSYSAAIESALREVLLPWLRIREPALALTPATDGRHLLRDELVDHALALGLARLPSIALVDDFTQYTLGGELGRLREFLAGQGFHTALIPPEALEATRGGRLFACGLEIDLVYRFLDLQELIAAEAAGKDLSGMHRAFEQGRVVPSVAGDLEHKSVFEIFSRADLLEAFPDRERAVLRASVPWTRLLHPGHTDCADGQRRDLVAFSEHGRERLVLKPNRGYGGHGVVLGPAVDQGTWCSALDRALAVPDSHVVQEYVPVDRRTLTVMRGERLDVGAQHRSAGLFPGRTGLCMFGRFAQGPVVNLHQGGGVIGFLLEAS